MAYSRAMADSAPSTPPASPPTSERAARQREVVQALQACVPPHALLWQAEDTTPYECDGLTAYRQRPLVVCLPETEDEVQAVLKACHQLQVPVVALSTPPTACVPPWPAPSTPPARP